MTAEGDDTSATPTPDPENTEHYHANSKPEGRAMSTFNSAYLTSEATSSKSDEQHNPSPGVKDTVPKTTKKLWSEKSDMECEYFRNAKPPSNERS